MTEKLTEFEKATAKVEKHTRKLSKAQNRLGWMYYKGIGVKQDDAEALRWYTKAAEQGDADAQYHLGDRYYLGEGVKKDYAEALRWWKKAAEQGHARAQVWLDRVTKEMESKRESKND